MNILFLCVANSARSQMAEGLAKRILGKQHSIQSAGSRPTSVSESAIQALREIDIDITDQQSKLVDTIDPLSVDLVITLCEEEVCPAFLGKAKRIHWPLPDPARVPLTESSRRMQEFRKVRDELKARLTTLASEFS